MRDLFGDSRGEPASPGSYGDPPTGYRLPAATRLGVVRLQVADLARSLAFYEDALGLQRQAVSGGVARLGALGGGAPLLELHERPGARPAAARGRLGLYHVAILLPDRVSLGAFVRHVSARGIPAGSADHLVSEAFYLKDPDGLGLEVYADRPRAEWRRSGRELHMASDPVDIGALARLSAGAPWLGMPAGTVIGHVHLHVGGLAEGAQFYSQGIGLDRMVWSYPGALFLAAGGYHHHLGTNTWAGAGARPSEEGDARLLAWTLEVPAGDDVAAVAASLRAVGYAAHEAEGGLVAHDPWGTALRVVASG